MRAVRTAQQKGPGQGDTTLAEKLASAATSRILRKTGIPNAVQTGHTLSSPSSAAAIGRSGGPPPLALPGQHNLNIALAKLQLRGGIVEICSPGQLCRNAAAALALTEAERGPVLWLALGSHAALAAAAAGAAATADAPVLQGRNLTLQHRHIATPADSEAALQELLGRVRSQSYSLVVLDAVPYLAPPLAAAAPPLLLQQQLQRAPLVKGGAAAAPALVAPAAKVRAGGPAAAHSAAAPSAGTHAGPHAPATAATAAAAAAAPARGCNNFKFLNNVLPMMLEEHLAALAASCGPGLRTTTVLLNSYHRDEQVCVASPNGSSCSFNPSRWALRAILRHAACTLHVLPAVGEGAPPQQLHQARSSDAGSSGSGGGGGGGSPTLHAVLTRGTPDGVDGDAEFRGPFLLPVRLPAPVAAAAAGRAPTHAQQEA